MKSKFLVSSYIIIINSAPQGAREQKGKMATAPTKGSPAEQLSQQSNDVPRVVLTMTT